MRTLVAANQLDSGKSQNKVVAKKSLFTVLHGTLKHCFYMSFIFQFSLFAISWFVLGMKIKNKVNDQSSSLFILNLLCSEVHFISSSTNTCNTVFRNVISDDVTIAVLGVHINNNL